jgi:Tol biopolymer transport system component
MARAGGDVRGFTSSIDWSPDGTQLAFSDAVPGLDYVAIYLFNLGTGEKRNLTSPPPEDTGDWDPKFSPDGRTVAFKGVTGFWADDIYVVPTAGGRLRRITAARRGIWGHAWTADGGSLIVSCQREGTIFGLWRLSLTPQAHPEQIVQGGIDAITPATSRRTSQVAWVSQMQDLNIYRT